MIEIVLTIVTVVVTFVIGYLFGWQRCEEQNDDSLTTKDNQNG